MSQQRYQVFVSSTFKDLKDEREAVLNAILKLNQFPAGMELFPATSDTAWKHIEKIIKYSDYYVLVIGGKYGSMDETGISYTEKEYDFAVSQNIPVLAFVRSDEENIPAGKIELDSDVREKLKKFKQKVGNEHHLNYWKSVDELKANVLISLSMAFATNPQLGWIKSSEIDRNELLEQLAKTQKKLDELQVENRKLKQRASTSNYSMISQGESEIFFTSGHNYNLHQILISWNSLFLEVARILVDKAKLLNYYLNETLFYRLSNYYPFVELADSDKTHVVELEDAMNQFVALDLIKATFDRQENLCWALTEKGRKVYSLQTAIKFKEDKL